MLLFAIRALGFSYLTLFKFLYASVGGVTSTAHCTLCRGSAGRLMMPKLLTVVASKRLRIVSFGAEFTENANVNFVWDLPYEGTQDGLG